MPKFEELSAQRRATQIDSIAGDSLINTDSVNREPLNRDSVNRDPINRDSVVNPVNRDFATQDSIDCDDATVWDSFVARHPAAHLLQTSAWGELKSRFGWTAARIGLSSTESRNTESKPSEGATGRNRPSQGAQILFRSMIPLIPPRLLRMMPLRTQIAYIPKGPLVDWSDRVATAKFLAYAESVCRARGAAVLKIEPDLPDTPANRELMRHYGFSPSVQTVQPQSTIVLDISDDEDAILARMKSKWRYNIRLATRKDVQVRECTRDDLSAFHELMQVTGLRDGFHVHSAEYFDTAFHLLVPDQAVYLLAEYDGEPLASIVVCLTGKTAWYLWGASSNRERNRMPNHALQWAAIRWARAHGATHYDLWGIPDAVGEMALTIDETSEQGVAVDKIGLDLQSLPKGELWGVYRLKQGFGGNVVRFVGAWDKPLDPIGYRLYRAGYALRTKLQKRKSHNESPVVKAQ